jgi:hypothetical protein
LTRPKQHHYVTRAYLAGFIKEPSIQLVCYGRGRKPFLKPPAELGKRRNYYAIRKPDGSWDDSLEDLIGRTVEEPGLQVIKKLTSGKTKIDAAEREALALLVAYQQMRTPAARKRLRAMSQMMTDRVLHEIRIADPTQTSVKLLDGKGERESDVTLDEITAANEELLDDHAKAIHSLSVPTIFDMRQIFTRMKWTIYRPYGESSFMTSDNPVIRVFHSGLGSGAGLNRMDVEVRFPLSRKALLTFTHDRPLVEVLLRSSERNQRRLLGKSKQIAEKWISDGDVTYFNRGLVRHCEQWVFAPIEVDWLESLLRTSPMEPQAVDLSRGDLLHFRDEVVYNPQIDLQ